jgi:hypothetical protein
VESLATIDVLDLDDPGTMPTYSVDRLDPVTAVANEPAFDDLRHGSPIAWIGHRLSAAQVRLVAIG